MYSEETEKMIGSGRLRTKIETANRVVEVDKTCEHVYGWDTYCDSYVYKIELLSDNCMNFRYCPLCGAKLV